VSDRLLGSPPTPDAAVLDQRLLRENPDLIHHQLERRGIRLDLNDLQARARLQRDLEARRGELQAEGNRIGKEVGQRIRAGVAPDADELIQLRDQGNAIKQQVAALEEQEKTLEAGLREQLIALPNLPSPHTPDGVDERDNVERKRWGEPRPNRFADGRALEEHWQIAERLGLLDSERSVRIAQSRFITLMGAGARLERALISFMLDRHGRAGYQELMPPLLVNSASLTGSGQLPKFAEESFRCVDDDLWLTPTAEVPLTSFHRDEVIPAATLPLRYVAHTPCFRREAGSYGRDTRGLIRLHQFNKVEIYWFCRPEESETAHEQLTRDAEGVLEALELPYRRLELCSGDLGFSAMRTFDLEVWLAGAAAYREISSCSTCGDFQARRANIRFKEGKGTRLVHTLNGSGLAVGRTMAALLENGQQPDGTVLLPQALAPYFGSDRLS
jgi:seryl-tRNA synthetase